MAVDVYSLLLLHQRPKRAWTAGICGIAHRVLVWGKGSTASPSSIRPASLILQHYATTPAAHLILRSARFDIESCLALARLPFYLIRACERHQALVRYWRCLMPLSLRRRTWFWDARAVMSERPDSSHSTLSRVSRPLTNSPILHFKLKAAGNARVGSDGPRSHRSDQRVPLLSLIHI